MGDHSSSEATLIDFGGEYRVTWEAQAPLGRSTARMTAPVSVPTPSVPTPSAPPPPPVQLVQRATTMMLAPAVPHTPPPVAQSFWCKLDTRLEILAEPDSARAEGFRLLLAKGLPRVLAVSSPAAGDGKTTCATNLTFALAEQTGGKLLLVDANFFAPALASMFSIDEYTRPAPAYGDPSRSPFKLTSLTPRLDLATIVLQRGEPLPRFDHETFAWLLGSFFRAGYERIILDAPALEGSPVVGRLLDVADGVLLAVRAGRTTERELRRAVAQIGPRKMMGAALMDGPIA